MKSWGRRRKRVNSLEKLQDGRDHLGNGLHGGILVTATANTNGLNLTKPHGMKKNNNINKNKNRSIGVQWRVVSAKTNIISFPAPQISTSDSGQRDDIYFEPSTFSRRQVYPRGRELRSGTECASVSRLRLNVKMP